MDVLGVLLPLLPAVATLAYVVHRRRQLRAPLPDGSSTEAAVHTRPPVLEPGMVVPVRVDLATRRAVLYHPPHRQLVRFVGWAVGAVAVLAVVTAGVVLLTVASL